MRPPRCLVSWRPIWSSAYTGRVGPGDGEILSTRSGDVREGSVTLSALTDRLTGGEADDVASQLPKGIKEAMIPGIPEAEAFGLSEFIERVARRAGVTPEQAEVGARAVMTTLREAITEGEFKDMMAQLLEEFELLVQSASSRA